MTTVALRLHLLNCMLEMRLLETGPPRGTPRTSGRRSRPPRSPIHLRPLPQRHQPKKIAAAAAVSKKRNMPSLPFFFCFVVCVDGVKGGGTDGCGIGDGKQNSRNASRVWRMPQRQNMSVSWRKREKTLTSFTKSTTAKRRDSLRKTGAFSSLYFVTH